MTKKMSRKDKFEWFVIYVMMFVMFAAALAAPELICRALGVL